MNLAYSPQPTRLTDGPSEIKQTAGRNQLGEFVPKFEELYEDVLFGEVWRAIQDWMTKHKLLNN